MRAALNFKCQRCLRIVFASLVIAAPTTSRPLFAADAAPPELKLSTDFPGGSAAVESIDQQTRTVRLKPAAHPDRGWVCWWHFKLSGITPGETITIDLGGGSFALADRATYSTDGRTWLQTAPGKKENGRIVYEQKTDAAEAWFAWGPPFTADDSAALVKAAAERCPDAKVFELCKSREGRSVPALRIAPADEAEIEHGLWFNARQHAWESGASWVCRGLTEWLTSDDERAHALRKNSVIYLVPIMDIDNVAIGAGGKEQKPHDHNRDWSDKPYHPAVAAAQREIKKLNDAGRFDMYIDLHNPGPGDKSPFFFIAPRTLMSDEGWDNLQAFLKANHAEMTGPLSYQGRTRESGPGYDANWKQISKNWVTEHTAKHAVSVTLETAWNTPASTTDGYLTVGRQLGLACERYFRGERKKANAAQ